MPTCKCKNHPDEIITGICFSQCDESSPLFCDLCLKEKHSFHQPQCRTFNQILAVLQKLLPDVKKKLSLSKNQLQQSIDRYQQINNLIENKVKEFEEWVNLLSHQKLSERDSLDKMAHSLTKLNQILFQDNEQQLIKIYKEAESLRQTGKYQEAFGKYSDALKIDPNNISSLSGKGICLKMTCSYNDALIWYDKALGIEFKHVISLSGKGDCLRMTQKYQDAIKYYDEALKVNPNDICSLYGKGSSLRFLSKFDEALGLLNQALKLNENYFLALDEKGTCLKLQGQYQEAIIWYNKALKINPTCQVTLKGQNYCQQQLGIQD